MRQRHSKASGLAPLAARATSWRLLCALLPDDWRAKRPCVRSRSASVYRPGDDEPALIVGLSPRWVSIQDTGVGHVAANLESLGWEVRR